MAESIEIMGIAISETFKANLAGNTRFADAFMASPEFTAEAFVAGMQALLKDMGPYLRSENIGVVKEAFELHLKRFLEEIKQ